MSTNSGKKNIGTATLSAGIAETSSIYAPGYSDSSSYSDTPKKRNRKNTPSRPIQNSNVYSDSNKAQQTYTLIASLAYPLDIGFDIRNATIQKNGDALLFLLPNNIVVIVKQFFSFPNRLPELIFAGTIILTGEEFLSVFAHTVYKKYKKEQKNIKDTSFKSSILLEYPLLYRDSFSLDDKVRSLFWDSLEIDTFFNAVDEEEMNSNVASSIKIKQPEKTLSSDKELSTIQNTLLRLQEEMLTTQEAVTEIKNKENEKEDKNTTNSFEPVLENMTPTINTIQKSVDSLSNDIQTIQSNMIAKVDSIYSVVNTVQDEISSNTTDISLINKTVAKLQQDLTNITISKNNKNYEEKEDKETSGIVILQQLTEVYKDVNKIKEDIIELENKKNTISQNDSIVLEKKLLDLKEELKNQNNALREDLSTNLKHSTLLLENMIVNLGSSFTIIENLLKTLTIPTKDATKEHLLETLQSSIDRIENIVTLQYNEIKTLELDTIASTKVLDNIKTDDTNTTLDKKNSFQETVEESIPLEVYNETAPEELAPFQEDTVYENTPEEITPFQEDTVYETAPEEITSFQEDTVYETAQEELAPFQEDTVYETAQEEITPFQEDTVYETAQEEITPFQEDTVYETAQEEIVPFQEDTVYETAQEELAPFQEDTVYENTLEDAIPLEEEEYLTPTVYEKPAKTILEIQEEYLAPYETEEEEDSPSQKEELFAEEDEEDSLSISPSDYSLMGNILTDLILPENFTNDVLIIDIQYHGIQKILGTQWETNYGNIVVGQDGSFTYTPSFLTITHFQDSLIDSFNCTIKNDADVFFTCVVSILLEELEESLHITLLPLTKINMLREDNILLLDATIYNPTEGDILYFDSEIKEPYILNTKNTAHSYITNISTIDDAESLIKKLCISVNIANTKDRYIALSIEGYIAGVFYKKQRFYAVSYTEGIGEYRVALSPEVTNPTTLLDEGDSYPKNDANTINGSIYDISSLPEHLLNDTPRIVTLTAYGVRYPIEEEWESTYGTVKLLKSGHFTYRLSENSINSNFEDTAIDGFECTVVDLEERIYSITVAIEIITINGVTCIRRLDTQELLNISTNVEEEIVSIGTILNPAPLDILILSPTAGTIASQSNDKKQLMMKACYSVESCEEAFSHVMLDISNNPHDLHPRFVAFSIDGYDKGVYYSTKQIYYIRPIENVMQYAFADFLPIDESDYSMEELYGADSQPIELNTQKEVDSDEEGLSVSEYNSWLAEQYTEEAEEQVEEQYTEEQKEVLAEPYNEEPKEALTEPYNEEMEEPVQEQYYEEQYEEEEPIQEGALENLSMVKDSFPTTEISTTLLSVQDAMEYRRVASDDLRIGGIEGNSLTLVGSGWEAMPIDKPVYLQGAVYKEFNAVSGNTNTKVYIANSIDVSYKA